MDNVRILRGYSKDEQKELEKIYVYKIILDFDGKTVSIDNVIDMKITDDYMIFCKKNNSIERYRKDLIKSLRQNVIGRYYGEKINYVYMDNQRNICI
ncbi:hypothetical protein M5C72_08535 [Companilactobacillus allii]|uniref:Uncharacterized protein n=1 Tax=Companilactobacillus allii TaxID=1847728 RepID=A0A1P8Q5J5_9LACO|nr:hypothetical protein [Companilactobacillus allii]APX73127.1 hypothetical protein BTM29_11435 [Companilactobacillus allii]USQ67929.1 hypothetical protein M5C72_08535 [Companilactobacillus allii]